MNSSSIDTTSFRLRATGASSDVPATVSYSGLTATLQPSSPLTIATAYQVTVAGSVTDANGNSLGSDEESAFTTVVTGSIVDNTIADFEAGTLDANTYPSLTGDGEVSS